MDEPDSDTLTFKVLKTFTDRFLTDNSTDYDYHFTQKDGISTTLIQCFAEMERKLFRGDGIFNDHLALISINAKDQAVIDYLNIEKQLIESTSEYLFSLTGHINSSNRLLHKRIIQNNVILEKHLDYLKNLSPANSEK